MEEFLESLGIDLDEEEFGQLISTLLVLAKFLLPIALIIGYVMMLSFWSSDEAAYKKFLSQLLGGSYSTYELSEEDIKVLKEKGFNTDTVANCAAASALMKEYHDIDVSFGICYAIAKHESRFGANMGDVNALDALKGSRVNKGPASAIAIQKEYDYLVSVWEQNRIWEKNPVAARYLAVIFGKIIEVIGHRSAGEVGDRGFVISTFGPLLREELPNIKDHPILSTGDPWHPLVSTYFSYYKLYIKDSYKDDGTDAEKDEALTHWNQNGAYRQTLIKEAKEYDSALADLGLGLELTEASEFLEITGFGSWRKILTSVFDVLGLLPKDWDKDFGTKKELTVSSDGGPVSVNLKSGAVPNDGQLTNFISWWEYHSEITIPAGQQWSFCAATNETGWNMFETVYLEDGPPEGTRAGGLCANATMLKKMAEMTAGLKVVHWAEHKNAGGMFITNIYCNETETHATASGGLDLIIKNESSQDITIVPITNESGDILSLDIKTKK